MSVIDALKRLERLGDEHSVATQKLITAAQELADHLCTLGLPVEEDLPRGYCVTQHRLTEGSLVLFLTRQATDPHADQFERAWLNSRDEYLGACYYGAPTRSDALAFAQDIATGWLDELADYMSRQVESCVDGTETMQEARIELGGAE